MSKSHIETPRKLNRRDLAKGVLAVGATLATPGLSFSQSTSLPFIGIYPLSGPYAVNGRDQERSARLALEDVGGQVLGRKIELLPIDDEMNPGTAIRKLGSAVQEKGALYVEGSAHSGIALAISQMAVQRGFMFWTSVWADEITGSKCNRNTFRWSLPAYGAVRATVPALARRYPEAKRWATITPTYLFGDSLRKNELQVLKDLGREHVLDVAHPIGEREFSGYITKLVATKPDVVVANNFGGDTVAFLKQAAEFGLTKMSKVLVVPGGALSDFQAIGADTLDGVYVGTQFWHSAGSALARSVNERYRTKFGESISYLGMASYTHVMLMVEAIRRAQSFEIPRTVAALEGFEYPGATGVEDIRASDHQVLKKFFLMRGKSKTSMLDKDDFFEVLSSDSSVVDPTQSECRM